MWSKKCDIWEIASASVIKNYVSRRDRQSSKRRILLCGIFHTGHYLRYDGIALAIRYASHTKEVIQPDDMHCLRMNSTSDEEDLFVTWWIKGRLKDEIKRRKYWVHHRFNKSGELGSIVVARAVDSDSERFRSPYAAKRRIFLYSALPWTTRHFPVV